MDNLDRQPGEKFNDWAWRIRGRLEFYDNYVSYPRSNRNVNQYINEIREKMQRPNLKLCHNCLKRYSYGHDYITGSRMELLHDLVCSPSSSIFAHKTQKALVIQKVFRRYIKEKHDTSARIIQQAVLPWLYKPGKPIMKKAEQRFNRLVELQMQ